MWGLRPAGSLGIAREIVLAAGNSSGNVHHFARILFLFAMKMSPWRRQQSFINLLYSRHYFAGWQQLAAREPHKLEVGGSSPSPAIDHFQIILYIKKQKEIRHSQIAILITTANCLKSFRP